MHSQSSDANTGESPATYSRRQLLTMGLAVATPVAVIAAFSRNEGQQAATPPPPVPPQPPASDIATTSTLAPSAVPPPPPPRCKLSIIRSHSG